MGNLIRKVDDRVFYIDDIQHSGLSGERYTTKIGQKYERRKNCYCKVYYLESGGLELQLYEKPECNSESFRKTVVTTKFISEEEKDGKVMLNTANSVYITHIVEGEQHGDY